MTEELYEYLDELTARIETPVTLRQFHQVVNELMAEFPGTTPDQAITTIEQYLDLLL